MQKFLYLLVILFLCACNNQNKEDSVEKEGTKASIENGIYLLLNSYTDSSEFTTSPSIIEYSHDFLDSNDTDERRFFEIDTNEFVPIDLAKEPKGEEQKDKRINLLLTLTDDAAEQLADFTEKHINQDIAMVIGGKAVTQHVVRTRIEGGKLQITRCTDNACEHLLVALKKKK